MNDSKLNNVERLPASAGSVTVGDVPWDVEWGQWIPCYAKLPELYETVLIVAHLEALNDFSVSAGYRHEEGWKLETEPEESMKEVRESKVLAWMPMPEVPPITERMFRNGCFRSQNAGTQRPGASDATITNQSAPLGSLE